MSQANRIGYDAAEYSLVKTQACCNVGRTVHPILDISNARNQFRWITSGRLWIGHWTLQPYDDRLWSKRSSSNRR